MGSIELWKLKEILKYTEEERKNKKRKVIETDSDDDSSDLDKKFDKEKMRDRREMMGKLLARVKGYKNSLLNNKLDELLNEFGDRRCKSMIDLQTGWPLEDDPRLAVTWPVSPMMRAEYENVDPPIKFTKEDAYSAQGNNVYADAKSKYMGMDFGTQDEYANIEFQDALNRKAGGLVSQTEGDLEERRNNRNNKRRGRKNKYYAQIDYEDDQEADQDEAPNDSRALQIIREQEEEEETIKRQVAAERDLAN